ncbi:hypothetical protein BX661DRAFT_79166 [Kickxella alabastrina]|uniref:uncharacterized protein n=1 Tax=Kickxella alabastrina TaxID=61397 RepID=UPI0022206B09|nr:uncharacterized protein BX661DRAFT_79166 [Kickxella alabastrina]KAI7819748.1 hypothetical protein BX661DRAFT_79166 [Kickxella alabastrina]
MACTQLTDAHSELDLFRAEVASLRGKLASSNAKVEVLQSDLTFSHANENILHNELASSRAMVDAKSRENTIALRMAAAAGSLFLLTCTRLTTLRGTLSLSRNEAVHFRARLELSTDNANNILEMVTSTRTKVVGLRNKRSSKDLMISTLRDNMDIAYAQANATHSKADMSYNIIETPP